MSSSIPLTRFTGIAAAIAIALVMFPSNAFATASFQDDLGQMQDDDGREEEDDEEEAETKKPKLAEPAEASGKKGVKAGDTIIDFGGKDIDGNEFSLSDYEGKVILLDFWGDW